MEVQIKCINKSSGNHDNPHEAISHYGYFSEKSGKTEKIKRQVMVDWVKQGNRAYVRDLKGDVAYCGRRKSVSGTEFLQTYADNVYTDNLLSLPECKE